MWIQSDFSGQVHWVSSPQSPTRSDLDWRDFPLIWCLKTHRNVCCFSFRRLKTLKVNVGVIFSPKSAISWLSPSFVDLPFWMQTLHTLTNQSARSKFYEWILEITWFKCLRLERCSWKHVPTDGSDWSSVQRRSLPWRRAAWKTLNWREYPVIKCHLCPYFNPARECA